MPCHTRFEMPVAQQRGDLDRDEQVHADDAPRHRERVPRARERDQHVGDAEVRVAVEQDRADVHADERERERTEVAVQAQEPRRASAGGRAPGSRAAGPTRWSVRISAQATMPLERATYQGIWAMGQLPLVVVCDEYGRRTSGPTSRSRASPTTSWLPLVELEASDDVVRRSAWSPALGVVAAAGRRRRRRRRLQRHRGGAEGDAAETLSAAAAVRRRSRARWAWRVRFIDDLLLGA